MSSAALFTTLGVYVLAVVLVGVWSARRAGSSPEEYFLAGRGLGTLVLFMALFGTNCTSFVLVGIPGLAYHDGLGIFSVNAPIIALGIPLTFYAIGAPARRLAAKLGALTPAELYAKRFGSRTVGVVLFGAYTVYTVPYMVQAVQGAAVTLHEISDGTVAAWLGGLGVLLVALLYTALGGMRGTAWTNVLQGTLFLTFMVVAFFVISRSLGGLDAATQAVQRADPTLLEVNDRGRFFTPGAWTSWGLAISLTVIGFPHMLVRLMAARDERTIQRICQMYPIGLVLLWVPAVLIGVWGAAAFPGLEGRESDAIFGRMVAAHLPAWLGAAGLLAVLAAVMSTLDAQLLTLSSMLVRDVRRPSADRDGRRRDVVAARWFLLAVAAVVYALAQVWGRSVFDMAQLAFSGYVTLTPALFLGVRWPRFDARAAIGSIAAGNAVLLALHFGGLAPLGFLPVAWALLAAIVVAVGLPLARSGSGSAGRPLPLEGANA